VDLGRTASIHGFGSPDAVLRVCMLACLSRSFQVPAIWLMPRLGGEQGPGQMGSFEFIPQGWAWLCYLFFLFLD
jgi:hypothetical protein